MKQHAKELVGVTSRLFADVTDFMRTARAPPVGHRPGATMKSSLMVRVPPAPSVCVAVRKEFC